MNNVFIRFFRFVYCRLYFFFRNVVRNEKSVAIWASSYAFGLGVISLPISIDLLISNIFNVDGFLKNSIQTTILVVVCILFTTVIVMPVNIDELENSSITPINDRFSRGIKDILVLLLVFGPVILMLLLMRSDAW